MKTNLRLLSRLFLMIMLTALTSCEKDDEVTPKEDTGEIMFYTVLGTTGGGVIVKVDGRTIGTLTKYYTSGGADCARNDNDGGELVYTGTAGRHSLNATSMNGVYTWDATFEVEANSCSTFKLY
ncbi:hypothetical protein [Tellurirhabdus rosea]|uniref:hypothetical protein n=1 Tax=Tellurirhabdus rosea TaxID=2674997 RepID=UPI00224EB609|nr:hypothetical protein [Tellurirhabdus rosea]